MKKLLSTTIGAIILSFIYAKPLLASDLLTVYQDALSNDPTFQVSHYQWLADKEYIGVTRSYLLPQLDLTGSLYRGWDKVDGVTPGSAVTGYEDFANVGTYSVSLSQTVFNYSAWEQMKQAGAVAKSSEANYAYAAQDLINRTATAYFNVIQAMDVLRFTRSYKEALAQELDRSKERYKVGLVAVTDVDQTQAQYDVAVSEELSAKNQLDIAKEQLHAITNKYYPSFAVLDREAPLLSPNPTNIEEWVKKAESQNYKIAASTYSAEAAHDNLKAAAGSNLPTINAKGNYDYTYTKADGSQGLIDDTGAPYTVSGKSNSTEQTAYIGLFADFPVVSGGGAISKGYQAEYLYQQAMYNMEATRRNVLSSTRQSYLTVISDIGVVQADKQAIISNTSALNSTQQGYLVGTQTMVDVLTAEANLYNAQKQFVIDQTNYILQTVLLKENTGTLSYTDLQQINQWLKENRQTFDAETPVVASSTAAATSSTAVAKKSPAKTTAKSSTKKENLASIEKEVLAKDPKHYTVQLIASKSQKEVLAFSDGLNSPTKLYALTTSLQGEKFYLLLTGDFATKEEAQDAADKFAGEIVATSSAAKPLIRTFASVQTILKS